MAFWRPNTMDSWNPFSSRFWTWGNLFQISRYERVLDLQASYLKAHYHHLETERFSAKFLKCSLSENYFKDPVMTPEGKVYERTNIERHLKHYESAPGSGEKINLNDLYPFPALLDTIDTFMESIASQKSTKAYFLSKARLAINGKKEYADVFKCGKTGQPIQKAVLTSDNKLCDLKAVTRHYQTLNQAEKISSVTPFPEFNYYLNIHLERQRSLSHQASTTASDVYGATRKATGVASNAWSYFWGSPYTHAKPTRLGATMTKPAPTRTSERSHWFCGF